METQKPRDIRERTFEYALAAVKLYPTLQQGSDSASGILAKQFLRSATSIGANVQEAQAGESRADFIHKLAIAQKEARESLYWLRLLTHAKLHDQQRLNPLIQETEELIAIITAIIVSTKKLEH